MRLHADTVSPAPSRDARIRMAGAQERRQGSFERRGAGPNSAAGEALWDAEATASYLSVSRSMIYKLEQAGELPCLRIGACIRFGPAVVRAFAKGERSTPAPAPSPRGAGPRR